MTQIITDCALSPLHQLINVVCYLLYSAPLKRFSGFLQTLHSRVNKGHTLAAYQQTNETVGGGHIPRMQATNKSVLCKYASGCKKYKRFSWVLVICRTTYNEPWKTWQTGKQNWESNVYLNKTALARCAPMETITMWYHTLWGPTGTESNETWCAFLLTR